MILSIVSYKEKKKFYEKSLKLTKNNTFDVFCVKIVPYYYRF